MKNFNKAINADKTNIRIGEVRFSYLYIFEPRQEQDGTKGKYGACILINKDDIETVKLVENAIKVAKENGKTAKWNGKIPPNCKTPLRDGDFDRPDDPAFENHWFFNANSISKPGVKILAGGCVTDALDSSDVYSGCFGAVTVSFYPYDSNGNRGIAAGLNNLIKTSEGERLAGGRSAEEDFADLDEEDELT